MKSQSLGELLRAAMLSLFATAGKAKPTRTRKPQRHFQYPSRANPQSIAHYDVAVRAWMDGGRQGQKPSRRVKSKQAELAEARK